MSVTLTVGNYLLHVVCDGNVEIGNVTITRRAIGTNPDDSHILPQIEISRVCPDLQGSCRGLVELFAESPDCLGDESNPLLGGHFCGANDAQVEQWMYLITGRLKDAFARIGIHSTMLWKRKTVEDGYATDGMIVEMYGAVRGRKMRDIFTYTSMVFTGESCLVQEDGEGKAVRFWIPYSIMKSLIKQHNRVPSLVSPIQCLWICSRDGGPMECSCNDTLEQLVAKNMEAIEPIRLISGNHECTHFRKMIFDLLEEKELGNDMETFTKLLSRIPLVIRCSGNGMLEKYKDFGNVAQQANMAEDNQSMSGSSIVSLYQATQWTTFTRSTTHSPTSRSIASSVATTGVPQPPALGNITIRKICKLMDSSDELFSRSGEGLIPSVCCKKCQAKASLFCNPIHSPVSNILRNGEGDNVSGLVCAVCQDRLNDDIFIIWK